MIKVTIVCALGLMPVLQTESAFGAERTNSNEVLLEPLVIKSSSISPSLYTLERTRQYRLPITKDGDRKCTFGVDKFFSQIYVVQLKIGDTILKQPPRIAIEFTKSEQAELVFVPEHAGSYLLGCKGGPRKLRRVKVVVAEPHTAK